MVLTTLCHFKMTGSDDNRLLTWEESECRSGNRLIRKFKSFVLTEDHLASFFFILGVRTVSTIVTTGLSFFKKKNKKNAELTTCGKVSAGYFDAFFFCSRGTFSMSRPVRPACRSAAAGPARPLFLFRTCAVRDKARLFSQRLIVLLAR